MGVVSYWSIHLEPRIHLSSSYLIHHALIVLGIVQAFGELYLRSLADETDKHILLIHEFPVLHISPSFQINGSFIDIEAV